MNKFFKKFFLLMILFSNMKSLSFFEDRYYYYRDYNREYYPVQKNYYYVNKEYILINKFTNPLIIFSSGMTALLITIMLLKDKKNNSFHKCYRLFLNSYIFFKDLLNTIFEY